MTYAQIVIIKRPGAFDAPLTYRIPEALKPTLRVGQGVVVPLKEGETRGVVVGFERTVGSADENKIKDVIELIPELCIDPIYVQLAQKMATYYHCSILRCLKLMLPRHLWRGTGKRLLKKWSSRDPIDLSSIDFPLKPFKHQLTPVQVAALTKIRASKKPVLLHGVTGSGKTELYLRLILEVVQKGQQAILLLPEIGLTPQMIDYFSYYFGDYMAVFHSKLSDGDRLEAWLRVQSGEACLVIGSRSAIFAPMRDLGLLILDEEHAWTYKQESSPYYQTHHVAEMLVSLADCQLIFGTATPRLETLHHAQSGRYGKVDLPERVNQTALPNIEVVDLREEFKKKNYSIFSYVLFNKMKEVLARGEQVILFVNQRGVSRAVVCRDCGESITCPHCHVSLKWHEPHGGHPAKLLCHYCSFEMLPVLTCPSCGSPHIKQTGIGTQRVEREVLKVFPGVQVIRADKDTTSNKQGFQPIYEAFKKGDYQVLVGTQMVAKGLDFPRVSLIGIILADIGLNIPDFRSHERLFHLITQVSGRAGRGERVGEVVLQTYQPDHHAIRMAANYEFEAFAEQELVFRKKLRYPPYHQLIKFTVLGRDVEKLRTHLQVEKEVLEDVFKTQKLNASVTYAPALIPKMGEFYYYHVLVRSPNPRIIFDHWQLPAHWRVDVDPIHTA